MDFYNLKIVIDPSCKNLIRDLELVSYKENGKNNEIDKSDQTLTHASDAFGYAVWEYLPLKAPSKRSSTKFI